MCKIYQLRLLELTPLPLKWFSLFLRKEKILFFSYPSHPLGSKSLSLLSFFEVVPKATLLSNFYGQNIEYKHNIYVKIIYFSHLFSTKTRSNFPLQINPLGKPSETRTTKVVRNAGCTRSRYTHSEFFFNQLMNELIN